VVVFIKNREKNSRLPEKRPVARSSELPPLKTFDLIRSVSCGRGTPVWKRQELRPPRLVPVRHLALCWAVSGTGVPRS